MGIIALAIGNDGRWNDLGGWLRMRRLIIKEDVRMKRGEDILLADTAQKEGLIDTHIPVAQRFDGTLMRGYAAGGDQRCTDG